MTLPSPLPQIPGLPVRRRYADESVHIRPLTEDELQDWLENTDDLQDTIDLWDKLSGIPGLLDTRPVIEVRQQHGGPGPHKSGSPQDVHGGKGPGKKTSTSTTGLWSDPLDVRTIDDLRDVADFTLPADDAEFEYFYHSFRWSSQVDEALSNGLMVEDRSIFLSKDEIRDRGAGAVIVRVPRGRAKEGIDRVAPGLSYREWTVDRVPAQDIVRVSREVYYLDGGGHGIPEHRLASWALTHQGEEDTSDLPAKYRHWFTLGPAMSHQHGGPGPHPGTGTSQDVHAKGIGKSGFKGKGAGPSVRGVVSRVSELKPIIDRLAYFIRPDDELVDVNAFGNMATHAIVLRDHPEAFGLDASDIGDMNAFSLFGTMARLDLIRVTSIGDDEVSIDVPGRPSLGKLQNLYHSGKLPTLRDSGLVIISWGESNGYDDIRLSFREFLSGNKIVKRGGDFHVNRTLHQHARRLAEIFFDQATGVWRYVIAGRRVPDFRIKMGVQRVANAVQRDLRDLTGQLVRGEISRQQWYDAMRVTMKNEYRAAYLASIGGLQNYTRTEISKFGWRMRPHYRWLNNFLAEIESGKQPLNGFAVVRAGMYARAANGIYENERTRLAAEAGYLEARRKLGPNEEHCTDSGRPGCVELAAMGWVPIDEMIPIGEATCLSHCLCGMEFRK